MELENIVANTVYLKAREGKSELFKHVYLKLYISHPCILSHVSNNTRECTRKRKKNNT